jgi:hypothetical protein
MDVTIPASDRFPRNGHHEAVPQVEAQALPKYARLRTLARLGLSHSCQARTARRSDRAEVT